MELSKVGSSTSTKAGQLDDRLTEVAASAHGAVEKMATKAGDAVLSAMPAIGRAADLGHQAVDKVQGAVKPAEQWISEKADALRTVPKEAADSARQYIVDNPWKSVGAAALVGLLVGQLRR